MAIPSFREDGWLPVGHHPATWEEVVERFAGDAGSGRAALTEKLLKFRDELRACGVIGYLLLNGSFISAKREPKDFDVLLVGPPEIQALKDADPRLGELLDAEHAEKVKGFSLFYLPEDSSAFATVITFWDQTKEEVAKGSVKVSI